MTNHSTESWSWCIGRWRGVDVRLHIQLPLLALLVWASDLVATRVAVWALLVLVASVALHELVRVIAAVRVGGHVTSIVLGPVGGWTKLHLPVDPPAHLITALVGPITFFVLMIAAGCGLSLAGDSHVLRLLLSLNAPPIDATLATSTLPMIGQLVVWVNWCLLLISLLPIDPCDGAQLLRGVLWPVVGRTTATSATSQVALGAAIFAMLFSVITYQQADAHELVAPWLLLAVTAIFLFYGGIRNVPVRRYDVVLAIDEFDSDDEEWLSNEWQEDDRKAVLVEHLQDKQQEALDRKRREREANEDARVDAILARMRDSSFEQLSEEDRAVLKRASRRYRQRRSTMSEEQQ